MLVMAPIRPVAGAVWAFQVSKKWHSRFSKATLPLIKYIGQHLVNEFKRPLDTSRQGCLQSEVNQVKSACIPSGVRYHPIIFYHLLIWPTNIYFNPSHVGMIMEAISASEANSPLTIEDFEKFLGSSNSDNYATRVTCQPLVWGVEMQNLSFSSHSTGQVFKVKFHTSSKSSKLTYLGTCRRRGLQYVDEIGEPLHTVCKLMVTNMKSLLWRSTSTAKHMENHTWQSWSLSLFKAVCGTCLRRYDRAGGSGPWELHPFGNECQGQ